MLNNDQLVQLRELRGATLAFGQAPDLLRCLASISGESELLTVKDRLDECISLVDEL